MEAVVVGAIPGGGGDAGGGSQPANTQPQQRSGGARPGDFAARMEALRSQEMEGFGGSPIQKRSAELDPSVTDKAVQPDASDQLENYEEQPNDGDPAAVEGEYTDPADVARVEFMSKLETFLSQGRAPMDMLGDLLITKKLPNGREFDVTLSELDRGYMRQGDYTRKLQEAQHLANRANHMLGLEQNRNQSWQNEDVMLRDLLNLVGADAVRRMVMRYAKQDVEFRALPEPERQRIMLQRQADQQRAQYEQRIAQLEQKINQPQQADQQAEATRHFESQLNQLLPAAFKQFGLRVYPESKSAFMRNIEALYQGGPCTRELVNDACQATKDQLEHYALLAAEAAGQRPRTLQAGLRPRPLSGGTGPGVQQSQGNGKRRRPSEFNSRFSSSGM